MTVSIFDPNSESYGFYDRLFSKLAVNSLLAEAGHCKYIKDMNTEEFVDFVNFVRTRVTISVKPTALPSPEPRDPPASQL